MGPRSCNEDDEVENGNADSHGNDILIDPEDGHELDLGNEDDRQVYWDINHCT
ncbi:MAG: hypothetical protein HY898_30600 [Deltaproteobacteria bacterium]|nr:hypothetical protein [Deltaproteobacteria bacterium]